MSSSGLQCIQSVKNRTRTSSAKGLEATVSHCDLSPPRRKNSSKNQLYDIEIIDQDGSRVKVHYIGYSSEYDEWKPKTEVKYVAPTFTSVTDEPFSPLKELACSIKRKLLPCRSGDPDVRIQVPCDITSFTTLQELGIPRSKSTGRDCCKSEYTLRQYSDLDSVLGEKWHLRVVNEVGDFSYVMLETISFYMTKGRPILDYSVEKDDSDELVFKPMYIEQSLLLIFKFVRGDGNKRKLLSFL